MTSTIFNRKFNPMSPTFSENIEQIIKDKNLSMYTEYGALPSPELTLCATDDELEALLTLADLVEPNKLITPEQAPTQGAIWHPKYQDLNQTEIILYRDALKKIAEVIVGAKPVREDYGLYLYDSNNQAMVCAMHTSISTGATVINLNIADPLGVSPGKYGVNFSISLFREKYNFWYYRYIPPQ